MFERFLEHRAADALLDAPVILITAPRREGAVRRGLGG